MYLHLAKNALQLLPLDLPPLVGNSSNQCLKAASTFVHTLISFQFDLSFSFSLPKYKQYTLGWFTYSYCHGKYVKQFREAAHAHPHPPGKFITLMYSQLLPFSFPYSYRYCPSLPPELNLFAFLSRSSWTFFQKEVENRKKIQM